MSIKFKDNSTRPDGLKSFFGDANDLAIYHDGSHSYIEETGTGRLILSGGSDIQLQSPAGELMADFNGNGSVDLYYNNVKKFETTTFGSKVTGYLQVTSGVDVIGGNIDLVDNSKIRLGTSQDLQIYHDGSHSYISDTGTGDLNIVGNNISLQTTGGEQYAAFIANGAAALYYDNAQKLATTSTGVAVTGDVSASGYLKLESQAAPQIFMTSSTAGTPNWTMIARNDGYFLLGRSGVSNDFYFDPSGNATFAGNVALTGGSLSISGDGSNAVTFTESGNGDFTIDAPDDIRLDAGGGDLVLRAAGTEFGRISKSSNDLSITSSVTNSDILLIPNGTGNVGIGTISPSSKLELGPNGSLGANITNKNVILNIDGGYGTTGTPSSGQYKVIGFTGTTKDVTDITGQTGGETSKNFYAGIIGGDYFNTNRFSVWQNGVERLTIVGTASGSGNVGIGTTAPGAKLEVNGNTRITRVNSSATYQQIEVTDVLTTFNGQDTDGYMHYSFNSNNTPRLYINGFSGNVGIGTTSVDEKLQVEAGNIKIEGGATSTVRGLIIAHTGQTGNQTLLVQDTTTNRGHLYTTERALRIEAGSGGGTGTGETLDFWVNGSERMMIDTAGNVGIGTTSPATKLHVEGNVLIDAYSQGEDNGLFFREGFLTTDQPSITVWDMSNAGASPDGLSINAYDGIRFRENGGEVARFKDGKLGIGTANTSKELTVNGTIRSLGATSSADFYSTGNDTLVVNNGNANMRFWNNGSERMRITSAGNVGIGTTAPSQKLHVVGKGLFTDDLQLTQTTPRIDYGNTTTAGALRFWSTNAGAEKMRITSAGNVGIGTTGPAFPLEISSNTSTSFVYQRTGVSANKWGFHSDNDATYWQNVTSGNLLFTLQNGGNVGIGTTAPAYKLHVNGGDAQIANGSTGTLYMNNSSNYLYGDVNGVGIIGAGDNFRVKTNSAERMRITSAGDVGVGAASPLRRLHVAGGQGFAVNASTSQYYGVYIPALGEGADPRIDIGDWHNAGSTIKWDSSARSLNLDTQYSTGAGTFNITGNDGASTFLTILPSGNVGIGTTSPATKLDVDGVVTASEFSADVNNVSALRMKSTASTIGYGVTNADLVSWSLGGVHPSGYYFRTTGANPAMQIIANGNVGIGVTNPNTKLHVGGIVQIVESGNTAFYEGNGVRVFGTQNYRFRNTGGGVRAIIDVNSTGVTAGNLSLYNASNVVTTKLHNAGDSFFNGGNVGIGTTAPLANLDISNVAGTTYQQWSYDNPGANNYNLTLSETVTAGNVRFVFDQKNAGTQYSDVLVFNQGKIGVGTDEPQSKLQVDGGIQMSDDTDTAVAGKVGTVRYRTSGNNSYVDMCMQTAASTYEWINIVQNNW